MIIDTHAHIDEIENLQEVLNLAKDFGVYVVIGVSCDYSSSKKILELAENINIIKVYPAIGLHPSNIKIEEIEQTLKFIEENISKVVAIGEIGLDFWEKSLKKNPQLKDVQIEVFAEQLKLAKEYSKPVIIHSRGAWNECYELVRKNDIKYAVFHWYSGPVDVLKKIIEDGYYISATPALEYSLQFQQAIKSAPIEKILVETDSPVRYKTSDGNYYSAQPKDVIKTLKFLSEIKELPFDEVVAITTNNAKEFFKI